MPRIDWIASNASLMASLSRDPDVDVSLVAPNGYLAPPDLIAVQVTEYPFYDTRPSGSIVERARGHMRAARDRRRRIDRIFDDLEPDCIIVISDTSRELLPFVRIARRRGVLVFFLQSVFLAPSVRRHIQSENWELVKRRGVGGAAALLALRAVQAAAGLPGRMLKSPSVGAASDAVFVINGHQRDVFLENVPRERIQVTGTPVLDFLRRAVDEVAHRSTRQAFCCQLDCDPGRPLVAYFSKSLVQFCHLAPEDERSAQEFFVAALLERLPEATVVVKLHPIEAAGAFAGFADHPRVRIMKELDVHALIHHSALVVSLGPSSPAFFAVFHRRPRLVIARVDDVVLEYQRDLLDVSVSVRSRSEYLEALDDLKANGWPGALTARFSATEQAGLERFAIGCDGLATDRVRERMRALLHLPAVA